MPVILIIEKNCEIKTLNIKTFSEEDLYKKCNFKSGEGFGAQTTWCARSATDATIAGEAATKTRSVTAGEAGTQETITLYAKTVGRANYENKYDFPPPVDSALYFGSCILVRRNAAGEVVDLSVKHWERVYESLMGGFEDLTAGDSEDDSEDEAAALEEAEDDRPRTKEGYVKDGFVVGDDDDDEDEDYVESEEEEKPKKKKAAAKKSKESKKAAAAAASEEPKEKKKRAPLRKTAKEIAAEVETALEAASFGMALSQEQEQETKPKKKRAASKKAAAAASAGAGAGTESLPQTAVEDAASAAPETSIYEESPELSEEEYMA